VAGDAGGQTLYSYRFGDVEFDEAKFELRAAGLVVEVQPKPLELLAMLLQANGEVVTRDAILRSIWRYPDPAAVDTNVIGAALTKLRDALKAEARRIQNIPKIGYRFEGPVERCVVGQANRGWVLAEGMKVPRREHFVLEKRLGLSDRSQVWRARHAKSGESRIFKFALDGSSLPTLKKEAALLRLLGQAYVNHPGFIELIDWSFEESPFLLEVEDGGQNLLDWSVEGDRLQALPLLQRLALFLQIVDAVAVAHSIGILHRDLKPANVLVTSQGDGWRIRLVDFGSGEVLDPEQLAKLGMTPFGPIAPPGANDTSGGTPLYLAPELIAGKPFTVHSDVYALGIMLYQLVIADLSKPWAQGWERDIADTLLREDIAAVTDGDPTHRMASAGELAERLRQLDQRRVERARQHAAEQAARVAQETLKLSRARRPWLIASVAILVAGLGAASWLYTREKIAHHQAQSEATRAENVLIFLNEDMIGAADPANPGQRRDATMTEALRRAAERLHDRFAGDPATKSAIEAAIGKAYFGLGDYETARQFQNDAVELLKNSRISWDRTALETEYALATTLMMQGKHSEADAMLSQADRDAGGTLHRISAEALLSQWSHGKAALVQMAPQRALGALELAERLRSQVVPADMAWLFKIGNDLAWCYARTGRSEEAVRLLTPLVSPQHTVDEIGIQDWSKAHWQYGLALTNLRRYSEAEAIMMDVVDHIEKQLGSTHYYSGLGWNYLAYVYHVWGRWNEAIDAQRRSYDIMRQRSGDNAQAVLIAASELAADEYLSGHLNDALPALQRARDALTEKLGTEAAATQLASFYLAAALNDTGRSNDAKQLLPMLNADAMEAVDPGQGWTWRLAGLRGLIYQRLGRYDEAKILLKTALQGLTDERGPEWAIDQIRHALTTMA